MKENLSLVKLAFCGPGDVAKEIEIARGITTEWNLQHGEARGFWLKHQHWSTDSHPDMSERAQGVINQQMVDDSDIIVAIFWSRFGTATGVAASGTEEEIRRGIQLKRKVMVYFSDLEPLPPNADKEQVDRLWGFRRELQSKGLCWKFSSREQFKREFARHLSLTLNAFDSARPKQGPAPTSQSIVGNGNIQAGRDVNIFPKPLKIKEVVTPPPGSVAPADLLQIKSWIEDLAENTVNMSRDSAYGMWGARFLNKFQVAKREQLHASRMGEVKRWYSQLRAMQTRGFKTKAPDEFKKRRIAAIKAAMNQMGATKEEYYPQLSVPKPIPFEYDPARIVALNWQGVDITVESIWKTQTKRTNSIQGRMVDTICKQVNQIVFDDDDSGEAADIVEIAESGDEVVIRLYHCKFSGGATPSQRVKDLYEVCGQAVRSMKWTTDTRRLLTHLQLRESLPNGRPTRFEKGDLKLLAGIKRRLKKRRVRFEISIVQPGLSKGALEPEVSSILGAASNYLLETINHPLAVFASA